MSVDTQPAQGQERHAPRSRRQVRIGRVILGSLTAGAASALILTLAVFPGATESVITGSMLLAFGMGWAMIAVLSARMTTQPQRWAAVPAVVMTLAGLALVVTSPQNGTLTRLNWLWPPVALTMAVWMFAQTRKALTGSGRWLLAPVLFVLGVASIGATTENFADRAVQSTYPAPGTIYSVGDHSLHLDCRGTGSPTVVLFNGMGEISASWARVTGAMADSTRVCAYDRAGQAWSDDVANPQDGVTAAQDLHRLLDTAGEDGPYVLAGHSIGGTYAMVYASQYPDQVAGMVLLDSSSPRQFTEIPAYPGQYVAMRRGLAYLPTLARLGLAPLLAAKSHIPGAAAEPVSAMTSTVRALRNGRDEVSILPQLFKQAQGLTTLGSLPLAVLSASETLDETQGWAAAQDRLARLSNHVVHVEVTATHEGVLEDQHGAAESVRAITWVVDEVRGGSSVAPDN